MNQESQNKIKELEKQIKAASKAYYNDKEIMSDDEFDALIYELSQIDPKNKLLSKVGEEASSEWKKEKHKFPMGSLLKVNTPEEMKKFIKEDLNDQPVVVVEKLDGLSVGLEYENGKFIKGLLRGNGLEAENISTNIVKMKGFKSIIEGFTGVIRGEIILLKSDFEKNFPEGSNPRNQSSGVSRRLDGEGCEHLTLMFYHIYPEAYKSESIQLNVLKNAGLIVPNWKLCENSDEVIKYYKEYQDKIRDSLDYLIDGLVVSVNDFKIQQELGATNLRPKGKKAFKFANQFAKTKVLKIEDIAGNSGRITPVCYFETVNLLGSNIEKASLYNYAYIAKLGLDVGAEVLVCKANEIIPRVEKVVTSTGTVHKTPENCPTCNKKAEVQGEYLQCVNSNCPSMVIGKITNWISELNILEFGESLIEKLIESGKVKTIADLYLLSIKDLEELDRMGKKSAKKCYDLLWAAKSVPLDIFIGGLSIPLIGSSTIRLLMAAGFDTMDKVKAVKLEQMENILGIGPMRAGSLFKGLKDNTDLIDNILKNGVEIKMQEVKDNSNSKLKSQIFVLTGKMENKRADLEAMVEKNGGIVKGAVTAGVHYLVINDLESTSSKATAAKKHNTKLISENDLLEMMK